MPAKAMSTLAPFVPPMRACWTAERALPGGDFPDGGLPAYLAQAQRRWPFLPAGQVRRLVHAYGTRLGQLLEGVDGQNAAACAYRPHVHAPGARLQCPNTAPNSQNRFCDAPYQRRS